MVGNLHSLLNSKWYIEPSAVNGMLGMLQILMTGGDFSVSEKYLPSIVTQTGNVIVSAYDRYGNLVLPKANEPFVLVNPIKTTIFKYDQACGPTGTKGHQKVIQEYLNNDMCVGVVLDIDSGGGQVSGTPEFYDFLKSANKPIHTYTDGYLGSAAYYIASATRSIVANPRADLIGSIGTMISFVDLSGYYEKQGAKVITEYATKSTAKNRSWRDLLSGNPENYIQTQLDPLTDTFIADVKNARTQVNDAVFDGSTYNAEDALQMGLIDQIGQMHVLVHSIFDSHKQLNSNNSNLNMKMSNHAKVMAVIGVATLAITDEKGTYFNEEQLQSMEDALTANENEKEMLTSSLAENKELLANAQANEQQAVADRNTMVNEIASALGMDSEATSMDDIKERIASLKPEHTNVQVSVNSDVNVGVVDVNASHNQLANQIFN